MFRKGAILLVGNMVYKPMELFLVSEDQELMHFVLPSPSMADAAPNVKKTRHCLSCIYTFPALLFHVE